MPVPKGRLDAGVDGQSVNRSFGTRTARTGVPALKRRAILTLSLRDNLVGGFLMGITSARCDEVLASIVVVRRSHEGSGKSRIAQLVNTPTQPQDIP